MCASLHFWSFRSKISNLFIILNSIPVFPTQNQSSDVPLTLFLDVNGIKIDDLIELLMQAGLMNLHQICLLVALDYFSVIHLVFINNINMLSLRV